MRLDVKVFKTLSVSEAFVFSAQTYEMKTEPNSRSIRM